MIGQRDYGARFFVMTLAVLEVFTLSASENTKRPPAIGKTGRQLPVWVIAGVKDLLQEVPSLPTCPAGYTVTIDDILLVHYYRELKPLLSLAQYEFVSSRRVSAFLSGHRFPLFLVGESPDLQFIQSLISKGMVEPAILLTKALLAHEVMHAWFDPTHGMSEEEIGRLTVEEFERRHEVSAYELQLVILKRDIAAGKYAAMYERLYRGNVDLTTAIENVLRSLRSGVPMQKLHFFGSPLSNSSGEGQAGHDFRP